MKRAILLLLPGMFLLVFLLLAQPAGATQPLVTGAARHDTSALKGSVRGRADQVISIQREDRRLLVCDSHSGHLRGIQRLSAGLLAHISGPCFAAPTPSA